MKRVVKTVGAMGLVGCAAISGPVAWADDAGWYAGASAGQARAKIDNAQNVSTLQSQGLATTATADRNRDTGYKIFGGYQLNKNLAVEAGYFDLGQFGFTTTTLPAGTLTGDARFQGLNLDAVGTLPITKKFSVFARAGLNYAQTRTSFSGTGAGLGVVPTIANPEKNQINPKLGLGIQYDMTESFAVRAEVERYRVNDAVTSKGDIDMVSLGFIYRFGVEKPAPAPIPVARVAEPVPVAVAPVAPRPVFVPPPPPPAPRKAVFSSDSSTDALFSFGKADIHPAGAQALDRFAADLKDAKYEVITVTGHTDRLGPQNYNLKLSTRRAEAVKDYLVKSAGIPADKIVARGVSGADPITKPGECVGKIATKKLKECLTPDRRVEVEVHTTRTAK